MDDVSLNPGPAQAPAERGADAWRRAISHAMLDDPAESLAGFGRWWIDTRSSQLVLSQRAADLLGVAAGQYADAACCLLHVLPEDLPAILATLHGDGQAGVPHECQFRLIDPLDGVRWLRLVPTGAPGAAIGSGVLIDVTFAKHAAMRERFNFALTQYLIGTDTLGEAVTRIIQLVCEDLGWEWGAYWAADGDHGAAPTLCCTHSWHGDSAQLAPFHQHSEAARMAAGEGLVGRVWSSGQAEWVDRMNTHPHFRRAAVARACGLESGYVFPVTYQTADGVLHRPGVLEFFSMLPRQREAQLPGLAASISALIAQTAQRMVQQERIRRLAMTDEMTGLANRSHFHVLLDEACQRVPPSQGFGVLYIDLDQFKPINDAFGHAAGNAVLIEFARRLEAVTPSGCAIGRLGGDEFAILATPALDMPALALLADQVLRAARSIFNYDGNELSVSASIGISLYPLHGTSTAQLLHAADAAMYQSKRNGRNLVSHFSGDNGDQQSRLAAQLTLLAELHHAHVREEFFLEYQPIFDSSGARVQAVEALIRWRKANGEIVPPDRFMPVAEQSRLIVHLGRWVVEQVCRDLPLLHARGLPELQVHVNMAAPEFIDSELPRELMAILSKARVAPRHLCLELTEGVVMSRIDKSLAVMAELRRLGFEISLDDFGMGYSSLSLLKKLPITSLKIDRLFVQGIPHDRDDCALVRTILDMGRNMRLRVIAEGVEEDVQLGFLRQFGCTLIQGYLLGRPMPLARLIAQHGTAPSARHPAARVAVAAM